MNKKLGIAAGAALLAACLGHQAVAATMTFNGLTTTAFTPTTHTENGLTMTASSPSSGTHFDVYGNNLGGTDPDNVAAVHTGNGGEQVTFTYSGGAFDLLSVDITAWLVGPIDPTTGTPAVFESPFATFNVNSLTTGVIDFSSMSGWSNILFFTLTMPISQFTCNATSSNCTTMGFDDVTFQATSAVPLPAALPLLLTSIGALGLMARRKNQRTALILSPCLTRECPI